MLEGVLLSMIAAIVAIAIGVFVAPTLANLLLPHSIESATIGSTGFSIGQKSWGIYSYLCPYNSRNYAVGIRCCRVVRCAWKFVSCFESSKNKTCGGNEI